MSEDDELLVLHLSDLHCGHSDCWWAPAADGGVEYTGRFHEYLSDHLRRHYGRPFDLLVLSGDLVNNGGARHGEYAALLAFLREFRDAMGPLWPPYMCAVPGNHDVNRIALEASGDLSSPNSEKAYELKFKGFRSFIADAFDPIDGIAHGTVEAQELTFAHHHPYTVIDSGRSTDPAVLRRFTKKPFLALGLNSAEYEGGRFQDHRGHVTKTDISDARRRHLTGQSPWDFRLAVIHHQPVLTSDDPQLHSLELIKECEAGGPKTRACTELSRVANYLHNSKEVLTSLQEIGVQLVLSGHRHFSDPQHYTFDPHEESPFSHGGISVLRTGCFGLREVAKSTEEPPSFSVVCVRRAPFRFDVAVDKHSIHLQGNSPPTTRIKEIIVETKRGERHTLEFSCQSARPLRVLDGLVHLFLRRGTTADSEARSHYDNDSELTTFLFSGAQLDVPIRDISVDCNANLILDPWLLEDMPAARARRIRRDIDAVILAQLRRDLLRNPNVYADLSHWSLVSAAGGDAGSSLECAFGHSRYLQYILLNVGLRDPLLAAKGAGLISFRRRHLIPSIERYSVRGLASVTQFLNDHLYLGLRTTLQVIFVVTRHDGSVVTFVKMRSQRLGHFRGVIQFPVGGGFKWALHESSGRTLAECVEEEIRLETGVETRGMANSCRAVTINTETFCPAFTFVVNMPEDHFATYFSASAEPRTIRFGGDIGKPRTLTTDTWHPIRTRDGLPRDWWEGQYLVPIEVESVDIIDISRGIADFFRSNGIGAWLDPYPGSCIELYLGESASRAAIGRLR